MSVASEGNRMSCFRFWNSLIHSSYHHYHTTTITIIIIIIVIVITIITIIINHYHREPTTKLRASSPPSLFQSILPPHLYRLPVYNISDQPSATSYLTIRIQLSCQRASFHHRLKTSQLQYLCELSTSAAEVRTTSFLHFSFALVSHMSIKELNPQHRGSAGRQR